MEAGLPNILNLREAVAAKPHVSFHKIPHIP